MDPYINWLLGVCGVLIVGISTLAYGRLGRIEDLMRDAISELRREDGVLHSRISEVDRRLGSRIDGVNGRVVRLETRCDTIHPGAGA